MLAISPLRGGDLAPRIAYAGGQRRVSAHPIPKIGLGRLATGHKGGIGQGQLAAIVALGAVFDAEQAVVRDPLGLDAGLAELDHSPAQLGALNVGDPEQGVPLIGQLGHGHVAEG